MLDVGVAFDLEGTSVDLEKHRHDAHLSAAASFGLAIDLQFAITEVPHFIGGPDEKVAEDIFDLSKNLLTLPKPDFVQEFLQRDKTFFEARLQSVEIVPRPGLFDFIAWLRAERISHAIGSLTSTEQASVILTRSHLAPLFEGRTVLREDVEQVKPAPDVFLKTAELMELPANQQIVFEDSPRGIIAAKRAASHPIGMPVIIQNSTIDALKVAGAYDIFEDWRDPVLRSFVAVLVRALRNGVRIVDGDETSGSGGDELGNR